MKYNRHFDYEVYWSLEYRHFKYLQDARRFLKGKTNYTIHKCVYNGNILIDYKFVESSN